MKVREGAQKPTATTNKKTPQNNEPDAQWQFHLEGANTDQAQPEATTSLTSQSKHNIQPVTWTASEFIAHQKTFLWYAGLTLSAVVFSAIIYLLTRDKISAAVIIVAALVLGFYGARKPRVLEYKLDEAGLVVSGKSYAYNLFKSFALVEEGAFNSIVLMPLKRFMPSVSIYFEPKDEKKITTILADQLPIQAYKQDMLDNFMRRIRF